MTARDDDKAPRDVQVYGGEGQGLQEGLRSLKLWGWKKTPKAFATVYQGGVLPSGFKAKMKASPVMMPGQRLFSAL